jgi:TRAP-type C4-dicarboxylate transport system permease large subunit
VTPFLLMDLFTLALLIAFPGIVLLLPNMMG